MSAARGRNENNRFVNNAGMMAEHDEDLPPRARLMKRRVPDEELPRGKRPAEPPGASTSSRVAGPTRRKTAPPGPKARRAMLEANHALEPAILTEGALSGVHPKSSKKSAADQAAEDDAHQLEIWPGDVRAIPNDYARSALFTVRNKREPRASFQGALIYHIESAVRITYTGIELRADDDELVWQQLLDYAKQQPLGKYVSFNLHQLCTSLGWSVNQRNYDRIRSCISRLKATELNVQNDRTGNGTAVSMIEKYDFEGAGEKGTKYRVVMDPRLKKLFERQTSTWIEWEKYRNLKPVERRLFDYIASHRQPFALSLEKLHLMCASDCGSDKKWKEIVRAACAGLVEAGLVKRAWVREDKIYCER